VQIFPLALWLFIYEPPGQAHTCSST